MLPIWQTTTVDDQFDQTIATVGIRLRELRNERNVTLAELSGTTGISISTLSRLESGQRKANLELLLRLASAHQVPLDVLIAMPIISDPRIHTDPVTKNGITILPLTRRPGGLQAYKYSIAPKRGSQIPELKIHEGYEWLYVLSGQLRLVLGNQDLVMPAGEAAEFDTRIPHWFGNASYETVEFLSLFGPQGERMHVRARPTEPAPSQSTQASI